MKNQNYFDSNFWANQKLSKRIISKIAKTYKIIYTKLKRKPKIMEVCGTHTMAVAKSGIRDLIGDYVDLISGPGCPVCVTSCGDIDRILSFSQFKDVIITTFGDMIKVKGSKGYDLSDLRIKGVDVRVVYSPLDALNIAIDNPLKNVIFIGVGFETTAPAIASTVKMAKEKKINNFYIAPLFKLVPPALRYLLDSKICEIDGFILPGHVSVIIGKNAYKFLNDYKIPSVISGFEPIDILVTISNIMDKMIKFDNDIGVEYFRAVGDDGNKKAISIMSEVFNVCDAYWRAVGIIEKSGYIFSDEYRRFDAFDRYSISYVDSKEPQGCFCGKILLGIAKPTDCPLFAKKCTPDNAIGPCMVSYEGACSSWYKYGVRK